MKIASNAIKKFNMGQVLFIYKYKFLSERGKWRWRRFTPVFGEASASWSQL